MTLSTIGRYEIISEIGRGGMATVYKARDPLMNREVAVKVLPQELLHDPEFRERFRREATTIAALKHPAIVPIYDTGEHHGQPYLVMPLMTGGSLADLLHKGFLPLAGAEAVVRRVASALDAAHAQGLIHRDVKPANILFDQHGVAYLADFGSARLAEGTTKLTRSGAIGTPAYMAPELTRPGGASPLVDVYALGATLFEMLAGRPPYQADTPMGTLIAHVTEPVPDIRPLRSDLPADLQTVFMRALAKEPQQRYPTAQALADAFGIACSSSAVTGPTMRVSLPQLKPGATPPAPLRKGWTKLELLAATVLVIGLVSFVSAGVVFWRTSRLAPPPVNTPAFSPIVGTGVSAPTASPVVTGNTPELRPENPSPLATVAQRPSILAATMPPAPDRSLPVVVGSVEQLPFQVIDAAYSYSLERIIIIAGRPDRLHIVDPLSNQAVAVDLPKPPTSLSLSPDGMFAAVGHDALISYIDLEHAGLVKTLDVNADVASLVLAGNGWVYAVPRAYGASIFSAISISLNKELPNNSAHIDHESVIRLSPDGRTIYGSNRNSVPTSLMRFDITAGPPTRPYEAPRFDGNYEPCGNIWLSEDGLRILSACGFIFRASTDRAQDMTYNGSLKLSSRARVITHSQAADRLIVIPMYMQDYSLTGTAPPIVENELLFFDYQNLNPAGSVRLPDFTLDGNVYPSSGRFVFVDKSGLNYYVLVHSGQQPWDVFTNRPAEGSNLPDHYGLVRLQGHAQSAQAPTPEATAAPAGAAAAPAPLAFNVVSAAYSHALDRLVIASADPPRLHIIDPASGTDQTIDLPSAPNALALSPDGRSAVVGHNQLISSIDLEQGQLLTMLPSRYDIVNLLLSGDNRVLLMPRYARQLFFIDLEIGEEAPGPMVASDTSLAMVLTTDLKRLYMIGIGIERYDLSGTAYGGNFGNPRGSDVPLGDMLWMAADSGQLFTACGSVFQTSPDNKADLRYQGRLGNLESIRWLTHIPETGRVFALPGKRSYRNGCLDAPADLAANELVIVRSDTLEEERRVALPELVVDGVGYAVTGRYIFANAAGDACYIIVQAEQGAGLLHDTGLMVYHLEKE